MAAAFLVAPGFADEALVQLSAKVSDSVVHISTERGAGSGFIVAKDMVVTNYHVVQGGRRISVRFRNGTTETPIGLLHADSRRDLVILKMPAGELMKVIPVSKALPKQGEDVAAFGNPIGFDFSVTRGIVSAIRTADFLNSLKSFRKKFDGTWLQTDAPISHGNSGGPLVNYRGEVVGVATFSHREGEDLNLAISCADVLGAIEVAKTAVPRSPIELFPEQKVPEAGDEVGDVLADFKKAMKDRLLPFVESLTASQLKQFEAGGLPQVLKPSSALEMKEGTIVRVVGRINVIQITSDWIMFTMDGVKLRVILLRDGAELAAKFGNGEAVQGLPFDAVYYVGKAQPYPTVAGQISYYIPVLPITSIVDEALLKEIADEERQRRKKEAERVEEERGKERERALALQVDRLRRTFDDSTGQFRVDATAIALTDGVVELVRMDTKAIIKVSASRLSAADQDWLRRNAFFIKQYGQLARTRLQVVDQ